MSKAIKKKNPKGLQFITNATGETTGLIIDLKAYPETLSQTIENVLLGYESEKEEQTIWENVTQQNAQRCYNETEPDYTDTELTWENPNFESSN